MADIQEFCASTGRSLQATPPMAAASQELTWTDVAPWYRIQSPDPAGVILVAPVADRVGFAPNALGTCARIAPGMDTQTAVHSIADTATGLQAWRCQEDLAGEGDEDSGAITSVYRFLRGTYTAEPGHMATSSLLIGWSDRDGAATYVFQYVVTTWEDGQDAHRAALDCVRIGEWTANEVVHAMRG